MDNCFDTPTSEHVANKTSATLIQKVCNAASGVGSVSLLLLIIAPGSSTLNTIFFLSILAYYGALTYSLVGFENNHNILRDLILTSQFHHFSIGLLFFLSNIRPIFYMIHHALLFTSAIVMFLRREVKELNEIPAMATLENLLNRCSQETVYVILEIATFFELILYAFSQFSLMVWICLIVYPFWILLFLYSEDEAHQRLWTSLSVWIRELAAQNESSFGPSVEAALDKIAELTNKAIKLYPGQDLKVHLQ